MQQASGHATVALVVGLAAELRVDQTRFLGQQPTQRLDIPDVDRLDDSKSQRFFGIEDHRRGPQVSDVNARSHST